jgi:nucleotide-binding universal stress UspA family protein
METIRKILAPTDLSDLSCIGVRRALEMAGQQGAEVIVYHVIDLGDQWVVRPAESGPVREMLERHRQMLDSFLTEKLPEQMNSAKVRQLVEIGTAAGNIVEKAQSEAVDMIVMSTHGRTGLEHLMIGSVSEKVVGRAPCPVLVMPAHKREIARAA